MAPSCRLRSSSRKCVFDATKAAVGGKGGVEKKKSGLGALRKCPCQMCLLLSSERLNWVNSDSTERRTQFPRIVPNVGLLLAQGEVAI
eukprot:scaffold25450_cov82-Skeletonema_dohrnii-CCMP3373.AAC.3